jgi:hypothetical protein
VSTEHVRRIATATSVALIITACARGTPPPDPTNELPFGFVDIPTAGATVQRRFSVHGWALDDRGIQEIRLYINSRYVASTKLAIPRPDVSKAYPRYAGGTDLHGWGTELTLPAGTTAVTLTVQAVDNQGATADLAKIPLKVVP